MPFDVNEYKKYLDNYHMSDSQKVELIYSVLAIVNHCIDRAFSGEENHRLNLGQRVKRLKEEESIPSTPRAHKRNKKS